LVNIYSRLERFKLTKICFKSPLRGVAEAAVALSVRGITEHVTCSSSAPILDIPGLSVLDFDLMYATVKTDVSRE